ncbi:threonine--tRNA ligase [bacterium]|nr:threonine--tRNA ligase [bacterium]
MKNLTFPDGSIKEISPGDTFMSILGDLPQSVRKKAVAAKVEGVIHDLREKIKSGGELIVLTTEDEESLEIIRHSASHLMALAVMQLRKEIQFGIGPATNDGFYYDFKLDEPFSVDDLEKIEIKMQDLRRQGLEFTREELSSKQAIKFFKDNNQPFKVELIEDLDIDAVTIYRLGSFVDLCAGPHVPDIKLVNVFKLLSIAGAYWRGDEKREMLQRLYGTAFTKKSILDEFIINIEEAKRRDHRKLGPQLGLFDIIEEAGAGLVFWYPKGYILREIIEGYWKKEHRKDGYQMITTPHIAKSDLWKKSGHYDYYRENMYIVNGGEDQEYVLKPMNCPGHILMYKSKLHSYRDLPVRYAELGTVYRNERSGTLHGLLRVRGFTQDDAHIFCTPEQLNEEIDSCFNLAHKLLTTFGFKNYEVELSLHDPKNMDKYAGSKEEWERAENALLEAVKKRNIPFKQIPGEAVFYGPKIDLKLIDALGRGWQATTIQFDFNLPRRFDVKYVNENNEKKFVYMVHRALLGSIERFVGTLIEHYAGEFPLWLSPVQVKILPVGIDHNNYATLCSEKMKESGIRVEVDLRREKLGYRIREAELEKIPYMIVVGDKEMENENVNVRSKATGLKETRKLDNLINDLVDEIERKD